MIIRIVIAAVVLLLIPIYPAWSLVYRESDGLFVYYPESEDRIAARLIEKFSSMQIGWGRLSSFRVGLGWPVLQPDYLDESGPVFLIQLGKPL